MKARTLAVLPWAFLVALKVIPTTSNLRKRSSRFFYAHANNIDLEETNIKILPMEKKYKLNYDPPRVTMVSFVVEEGLQMSARTDGFELSLFDSDTWDGPTSNSESNRFGDAGWNSGSSQGTDVFGTGSWN